MCGSLKGHKVALEKEGKKAKNLPLLKGKQGKKQIDPPGLHPF